jgi:hypothetical protein
LLYIDISMCRGSSQVNRFVAVLPASFFPSASHESIGNNRVAKLPFPQNSTVRTTHRNRRTYCQMQYVFSKSRKANGVIFPMDRPPGIPNPSSKSECSAPSVWVASPVIRIPNCLVLLFRVLGIDDLQVLTSRILKKIFRRPYSTFVSSTASNISRKDGTSFHTSSPRLCSAEPFVFSLQSSVFTLASALRAACLAPTSRGTVVSNS